jgi:5'-phosphate synthase pdxT subunit
MVMRCGVLALQGDWAAHAQRLTTLGVDVELVRRADQLARCDALVLPGGESTAMLRLMESEQLARRIVARVRDGLPVLATCAGLILLAADTVPEQPSLELLDIEVTRNAYGRQVHSMVSTIDLEPELGGPVSVDGVFIRAPRITRIGSSVEILGRLGSDPVLVRQGRIIAATYHPELSDDDRIHRLLLREETGHD